MKTLKTMVAPFLGIGVFVTGTGLTMAFGALAFIGMPILVVGLGLLSAAIDEIE